MPWRAAPAPCLGGLCPHSNARGEWTCISHSIQGPVCTHQHPVGTLARALCFPLGPTFASRLILACIPLLVLGERAKGQGEAHVAVDEESYLTRARTHRWRSCG